VTEVVLPTLAFVAIWALVAALAAGCGLLVRHGLLSAFDRAPDRGLRRCDVWIGLAALVAYLLVWNLFLAITWWTWGLPLAAAAAGLVRGMRGAERPQLDRRGGVALGAVGMGWLVLANQALGPIDDYDFGLYHANLIAYAEKYAAIPGLANLHSRLGAGDAHLLLAAFLDRRPLAGAGPHLAGGLLLALLLLDVGLRLRRPGNGPSFTRRLAALLVPATVVLVFTAPYQRVTSPNLDLAAFAAVAIGALYLAECVENQLLPEAALAATAALALASATRPLYWPFTAFAAAVFVAGAARRGAGRLLRSAVLVCLLPAVLALGWVARQAVLSGYPLYPLTAGGLSGDWRVPRAVITAQNRGDDAWARWPGVAPDTVLASWHWLRAWWLHKRARDLDAVAPLMLLAAVLVGLGARDPGRGRRTRPMLAVVVPAAATLAIWFFIAPDPRFVYAPIWLVSAGLVAWALPPLGRPSRRLSVALAGLTALAAAGLAFLGVETLVWMLPAALATWALATALAVLLGQRGIAGPLAHAAAFAVVVAGVAVAVHDGRGHTIRADGTGPLGVFVPAYPPLAPVATSSGLQLTQPANGGDQCFSVTLCVPLLIDTRLHLRGAGVAQGFSVARAR
jgi:hypothetical protein